MVRTPRVTGSHGLGMGLPAMDRNSWGGIAIAIVVGDTTFARLPCTLPWPDSMGTPLTTTGTPRNTASEFGAGGGRRLPLFIWIGTLVDDFQQPVYMPTPPARAA